MAELKLISDLYSIYRRDIFCGCLGGAEHVPATRRADHRTHCAEADDHHRPSGGLGNGRPDLERQVVDAKVTAILDELYRPDSGAGKDMRSCDGGSRIIAQRRDQIVRGIICIGGHAGGADIDKANL